MSTVLVGIVVRYTRLYINGGRMGASLIDVVLMGPPQQCSRYIWLIGVFITSFHLGSLVSVLDYAAPSGGGTTTKPCRSKPAKEQRQKGFPSR